MGFDSKETPQVYANIAKRYTVLYVYLWARTAYYRINKSRFNYYIVGTCS